MTLGVFDIPDKLPDDDPFSNDMHKKLAKWICSDKVCVLTGTFDKGNEVGIAETAVAAGASIVHRICTRFKLVGHNKRVRMSGGFIVFTPYNRLLEVATRVTPQQYADLGDDIIDETLTEVPIYAQIHGYWPIAHGNPACPNLWDLKVKPLCSEHHVPGMVQTRLYMGSSRIGRRNRIYRWQKAELEAGQLEAASNRKQPGQQLLQHTAAWKNLVQAKMGMNVSEFQSISQWEQAINAQAETAVAAPWRISQKQRMDSVKRQRGGEHEDQPKTAVAALTKRQKVKLGPRQPSYAHPSRLLWARKQTTILLEGEKADDDPARARDADESDDPCPFESVVPIFGKGKSSTLYAPDQKGKSKGHKGGKGKSKGNKGKKGKNCKSKGKDRSEGKDGSCGEMNPYASLSHTKGHDSSSDEFDRRRRYRPSPPASRHSHGDANDLSRSPPFPLQ